MVVKDGIDISDNRVTIVTIVAASNKVDLVGLEHVEPTNRDLEASGAEGDNIGDRGRLVKGGVDAVSVGSKGGTSDEEGFRDHDSDEVDGDKGGEKPEGII